MSKSMLAVFTVLALAACGRGDKRDVASADSLNRDLQLAPVDTTAPLNDAPAPSTDTAAAAPAPEPPAAAPEAPAAKPKPAAPKPAPKPKPTAPAAPAPATPAPEATPAPAAAPAAPASLASGTSFTASTDAEIRSNKNKVGDEVTATIGADVKDAAGHVVIPAGSKVTLRITAIKESENKSDSTGTLTVDPVSISVNGATAPVSASISGVKPTLQGRKTGAGDIAKVGVGTGAGAVVGRVIGGSTKGAIIGGIIGGAIGAQRAVETKDRDVVLPQGTSITIRLDESFKS